MDMRENHLSYSQTVRKYGLGNLQGGGARYILHRWERIYLEEGVAGFMTERRTKTQHFALTRLQMCCVIFCLVVFCYAVSLRIA